MKRLHLHSREDLPLDLRLGERNLQISGQTCPLPREDDLVVEPGYAVQRVFNGVEFDERHALVIVLLVQEPW